MKKFLLPIVTVVWLCAACNSSKPSSSSAESQTNEKVASSTPASFIGQGNEPFWKLQMDFTKGISFSTLNNPDAKIETGIPQVRKPQDVNATSYTAEFDEGHIHVMVFRDKCMDNMSGDMFDRTVSVSISYKDDRKPETYKGCGNFQGDYRLNDIWVLEQIDGEQPDVKGALHPSIEFNIGEKLLTGFGGCNRYSGSFEFGKGQVIVGDIMNTAMACLQQTIEDEFLGRLNGQTLNFEIKDTQLRLWNDSGSLLFKKVD